MGSGLIPPVPNLNIMFLASSIAVILSVNVIFAIGTVLVGKDPVETFISTLSTDSVFTS